MKIAVITSGSRGDIQPFLALSMGLKEAGHEVRLVTHQPFQNWIEENGITFFPLNGDPKDLLGTEEGQRFINARGPIQFLRGCSDLLGAAQGMLTNQIEDSVNAGKGMDCILYGFGAPLTYLAAEKNKIPALCVALAPLRRTRAFSNVLIKGKNFGGLLNYLSHLIFEKFVEMFLYKTINRIRTRHLGLLPTKLSSMFDRHYKDKVPLISAFSRHVIDHASDWPSWHPVTGYWFLPEIEAFKPPAELEKFLAESKAPIYVGLGSMVDKEADIFTRMVFEASEISGHRIILSKGWSGLGRGIGSGNVYLAGDIPHAWLFQRVAATVHHGEAGTTAATLLAGIPSLIVPFGVDQPFWGSRIAKIGVGLSPIHRKNLTSEKLAQAFERLTSDKEIRIAATKLGVKIRAENGVDVAIKFVEEVMQKNAVKIY